MTTYSDEHVEAMAYVYRNNADARRVSFGQFIANPTNVLFGRLSEFPMHPGSDEFYPLLVEQKRAAAKSDFRLDVAARCEAEELALCSLERLVPPRRRTAPVCHCGDGFRQSTHLRADCSTHGYQSRTTGPRQHRS